jgi:beta-glucosidase
MPSERSYADPGLPIEERVTDLLSRMSVREKCAQLGSVWAFELLDGGSLEPYRAAARLADGIGEITRVAGSTNLRIDEAVAVTNEIQRILVEGTRLGIPAIVHEECLHGLLSRDAPCFQQSIGAAAGWDPELVEAVAGTIRRRMMAAGARHALAPVLDIARDPRWGRIEETYGEDPYLAAAMGGAFIRGLQGPAPADGVLATAKHLVGHGLAEGGLNQAPAHAGWRELRDEQLFPFEVAVRDAGVASVMPAYCDVDGVPCHASTELLATILRGEWGFEGIVASDYVGIEMLSTFHRLTPDQATAAALALRAGVDLELPHAVGYAEPLERAVATGEVDESLVDASVARVLRAKFTLGLFERPYLPPLDPAMLADLTAEEGRLGRELARRSIVLLENNGILPLRPDLGRIAVIGPIADSARDLLGDYSHLIHMQTLLEMRGADNAFGFPVTDEVATDDELAGRRTVLDAIRDRFGSARVGYSRGCGIQDGTDAQIFDAAALAAASDVAVVVLGERSGLTVDATTGEFRDRRELGLSGRQQELLEAVVASGTPVVLVVVSGRPLAIEWAAGHCAAVMAAWVPGDEGPGAIAEVLAGDVNPGGKLPVTIPRHVGQVPLTYRHHPSGGRSNWKGDYVDGPTSPLWPFGFGRSYTTFELTNLCLDEAAVPTDGGEIRLAVEVGNVGDRAGDEVVQLYVRDEEASVARPVRELRAFRRIRLAPGERRRVSFCMGTEQLAYVGADYRRVVEPGAVRVWVGTSSADLPLSASVELVGPVVEICQRRRYLTETTAS